MPDLDRIDNLSLIENGLLHLQFELSTEQPSYFRIAREAHLILYRSMIESLKGTANLTITGRPSGNRSRIYHIGDDPWKEIHKVKVDGCNKAWRFSEPQLHDIPNSPKVTRTNELMENDDYLIGFYDALAMIQTECFMRRLVYSRIIPIPDTDMRNLEWLHERIRNQYEHFVPKLYMSSIEDLVADTNICLRLSEKLLFESGNASLYGVSPEVLHGLFEQLLRQINT